MNISLTESAAGKLRETGANSFRIVIKGYGWAGPSFGLAQDEPKKDDAVAISEGFSFSVEQEIADAIDSFEIDYRGGWLNRGFAVYPNGYRGSC